METKNSLYKIIFDTNVLWLDKEDRISRLFNSFIPESIKFIKENEISGNVFFAIPEIVVKERIEQTLRQIHKTIEKIDNGLEALAGFGVKISKKKYKKNYRIKINKLVKKNLSDNKIEIIKIPRIDQNKLIERSLKQIKPFGEKDKGFRDTLIWLSILCDAKKHKALNYIICTGNSKDFEFSSLKTEFKDIGKGSLDIVDDLKGLKELLDKKLNLKLKLKELYKSIENEIKQRVGDIMVKFNKKIFEKKGNLDYVTGSAITVASAFEHTSYGPSGTFDDEKNIIAYDFENIDIQNINKLGDDLFEIKADLVVRPRYKEERREFEIYHYTLDYKSNRKNQTYSIFLNYDRKNGSIKLTFLNKGYLSFYEY